VPRRHWDISFADALMVHQFPESAYLMMGLAGISGVIGGVGGGIFVLNMVGTLLWGKAKVPAPAAAEASEPAPEPAIGGAATEYGSASTLEVPGTFILALVFLTAFVLYYFVNWKYLASVWGLS